MPLQLKFRDKLVSELFNILTTIFKLKLPNTANMDRKMDVMCDDTIGYYQVQILVLEFLCINAPPSSETAKYYYYKEKKNQYF